MSASDATVDPVTGQIIVRNVPSPAEDIMKQPSGSFISAAANSVAAKTAVQNAAVTTLGGQKGGATQVQVHPPTMVTAGTATTHPNDLYANLYSIKAQGQTDASYDSLHSAQPMVVKGGKRKTLKRKHKKHARTQSKGKRHHVRHSRKRSHLRRSRRRLHERK